MADLELSHSSQYRAAGQSESLPPRIAASYLPVPGSFLLRLRSCAALKPCRRSGMSLAGHEQSPDASGRCIPSDFEKQEPRAFVNRREIAPDFRETDEGNADYRNNICGLRTEKTQRRWQPGQSYRRRDR